MKVNMTPNPLDVVTIHASQGDTEARQWEFELHNNGELIDTSDVTEQMFFKAYKGGTEQLLPENGSTPTTSPFKGDIKYPQGLLTDQEFTYRQSPTESDGLAKITEIKGNTLNWNQLVNGFPATTEWNGITITNNDGKSITLNGTYTGSSTGNLYVSLNHISADPTHWYLYDFSNVNLENMIIRISSGVNTGSLHGGSTINTVTSAVSGRLDLRIPVGKSFDNVKIVPQMFDLTQMFGAEIAQQMRDMEVAESGSGVAYFRSLFPLSYYSYNQGSLLSFMGNGIKTVGKNLFNKSTDVLNAWINTATQTLASGSSYRTAVLRIMPNTTYTISKTAGKAFRYALFSEYPVLETTKYNSTDANHTASSITFTSGNNYRYLAILFWSSGNGDVLTPEEMASSVMVEIGSSATSYEPYTSSTLSLPISTYFPNGMKSAGNVYDELTESKAITRIGSRAYQSGDERDTSVITDGTTTYYALVTPTETSFTTASLVTENAEIPLSNNDGTLIGKCTEQLSENPGFIDAKIKLTDSDGTCYSNKLQLHVERSPQ